MTASYHPAGSVRLHPQTRHPGKPEGFIRDPAASGSKRPSFVNAQTAWLRGFHDGAAGSRIGALCERLSGMTDVGEGPYAASPIVTLGLVPRVQGSAAAPAPGFQPHRSGPVDPRHRAEDDGMGVL
jgi:hypothetical protein